jgi:hypothetical protein
MMRGFVYSFLILAICTIAMPLATAAKKSALPTPPAAPILASLDLAGELQWYYRNDVGILLVYASDRLYRLDLLADDPQPSKGLSLPGLTKERSVLPVAHTGLLLIPDAPLKNGSSGSYAFDTLSGEVAWEAAPLPAIDLLFSFPDAGLAILRSPDNEGQLIAINLITGERVWEIAEWARLIWTEAPYLRILAENRLLTLNVHTGETVREDDATLPESKLLYVYAQEGIFLLWADKHFTGYSVPPAPPADAAPTRKLWKLKAGGPMLGLGIKTGSCSINRVGDDMVLVAGGRKNELIRLTTGELIFTVKHGMFGAPASFSPNGKYLASAAPDRMRILNGASGTVIHEMKYPKGGEGMKSMRYMSWPSDDLVMTVFPDKKGNPRKMSVYSCSEGALAWSKVLPEVANYMLTSKQKAKLAGRIIASLVMTAVSAANPVSAGGYNYFAVFVPNLNVSESLSAGMGPGSEGDAGGEPLFAAALERHAECERLSEVTGGKLRYFVTGPHRQYDILKIDLISGSFDPVARYEAEKVHGIAPFPMFGRAVTLENNNLTVRLIDLE